MLRTLTKSVIGAASSAFDRAVTLAVQRATDEQVPRDERKEERVEILSAMIARYADVTRSEFHPEPRPVAPTLRRIADFAEGLETFDVTWQSECRPFLPEVAGRYLRTTENHIASARLFRRGSARPVVVILHGYMSGNFRFEQRVWPIAWFDRLGLDSVLFTLPFHGRRADPRRRGAPEFPGKDPRFANEGFRQAIFDLRGLVGYFRAAGHPSVGLLGMSLGGYTVSLAATLEPSLDFVVPIIPLASLSDFVREQGGLSASPELAAREQSLLDEVHRLVSPLAVPSLVPRERLLVIGARADRITPVSHARRLANHFGAPLFTWQGGHLLQFGRGEAFGKIAELFASLGIIPAR